MSHDNLLNYYRLSHRMMADKDVRPGYFDDVPTFERDIYIDLMLAEKDQNNSRNLDTQMGEPKREEFE